MFCKRCGAALPGEGAICKQCGAMMSKEQLEEQKKWQEIQNKPNTVNLMSQKYGVNKDNFKYESETKKENKLLGAIIIFGVFIIIVIIAFIKFFA
ncbi:MAG: hypothetical protein IJN03_01730 [Bacilli bacterium]|nr:hypothetical protein [Bacilli bacterium]